MCVCVCVCVCVFIAISISICISISSYVYITTVLVWDESSTNSHTPTTGALGLTRDPFKGALYAGACERAETSRE